MKHIKNDLQVLDDYSRNRKLILWAIIVGLGFLDVLVLYFKLK